MQQVRGYEMLSPETFNLESILDANIKTSRHSVLKPSGIAQN